VHQNPQHRSLLTVFSVTSAPLFQPLPHQRNVCHVSWSICEPLCATNTSHRKQEIFIYEYSLHWVLLPTKVHNRTLIVSSIILKDGRHFYYWNKPLNMRMQFCYLDYYEAGLCCYLVIHTENLFHQLQLFYFHLWPIYCLSLVTVNTQIPITDIGQCILTTVKWTAMDSECRISPMMTS
jgi:hypothetical protein